MLIHNTFYININKLFKYAKYVSFLKIFVNR